MSLQIKILQFLRSYVFGSLYSKYSRSTASEEVLAVLLLASGLIFTSGYISASQASPPNVSQASAGKTLWNYTENKQMLIHDHELLN